MPESSKARQEAQGEVAETSTTDLQGEIITTVNQSQDAVIEAIRDWADAVQAVTPKLPPLNAPFAGNLPQPEELVASAYDFAEQLLSSQRRFAEELVRATSPLLPIEEGAEAKSGEPSQQSAAAAQTGRLVLRLSPGLRHAGRDTAQTRARCTRPARMRFVEDRDQAEAGAPLPCKVLHGRVGWNSSGMTSGWSRTRGCCRCGCSRSGWA